jgi:hypothetical protein
VEITVAHLLPNAAFSQVKMVEHTLISYPFQISRVEDDDLLGNEKRCMSPLDIDDFISFKDLNTALSTTTRSESELMVSVFTEEEEKDDDNPMYPGDCLSSREEEGGETANPTQREGEVDKADAQEKSTKKTPARKRFPCRARNVCGSHTSETAYIELPHDATHGLHLYCSHPQCKVSKRAFRWCDICQVIVAKRNFIKRHSHGLLQAARRGSCMKIKKRIMHAASSSSASDLTDSLRSLRGSYVSSPVETMQSDDECSIEAIGSLKGWEEADMDSIFEN